MKMHPIRFIVPLLLFVFVAACTTNKKSSLDMDNYFAWCIVPFDNQNRTPAQRMEMLKSLGFQSYAYDWRQKHLVEMKVEFNLAKQNNIHVNAVWMWIDVADSIGHLSTDNETILEILKDTGLKTQLWMGISEAYFAGLSEEESMAKAVAMVGYLSDQVALLECKIGLYNHGGWFGDPINQVKLIKAMPGKDLGIIFNFHHAHELLDQYPALVDAMMPYLWAVNLNGMKAEGPKILPIGSGDREGWMMNVLKEKGFTGPFGILGHVDDADVKIILEKNLEGLRSLQ